MGGKKFRFPLQSVLTLRTYEAERARQTLGRAAHERHRQELHLEALQQRADALRADARPAGRLDPLSLRRQAAFRRDAERACDAARRHLGVLEAREGDARDALRHRDTAEASIQTLHDRARAQHRHDQDAAELEFLDEQALMGFRRTAR